MIIKTIDIETSPHLSFHWGRWQQNIFKANTIEESRMICWASKTYGSKKVEFMSEWTDDYKDMLDGIWTELDEADVIIGFNSNKFDIKRINAEFLRYGMEAPSPYQKIDLLLQARKHFAFSSNKLADLLVELELEPKLSEGVNMQLWIDVVLNEKKRAQQTMRRYNIQDVVSTEKFYDYLLGWIEPHPNWGLFVNDVSNPNKPTCPNCGGKHLKKHKKRYTKTKAYMQWYCGDCGKYSKGRKALVSSKDDQGVLS
jgi:ribosomal protein S27AE/DNA polymerase elongation subunit (family B)